MSSYTLLISPLPLTSHSLSSLQTLNRNSSNPPLLKKTPHPISPLISSPKPTSQKSPSQPQSQSPASWIETLRSQTRSNHFSEAISTYIDMIIAGIPPNNFAFPAVLKAVSGLKDLNCGKMIHAHVFKFGYVPSSSLAVVDNTLLNMYGKCGDICDVYKVFERISERDQVSWNSMIAGFCRFEKWENALVLFRLMQLENVKPSSFTLVSMALACSNLDDRDDCLRLGKQVHAYSLRMEDGKIFTINSLMAMYAKLGRLYDAKALFELFMNRDMVSWNTMISSLSQNGQFLEALKFLQLMLLDGINPDGVTIASVLPACSNLELLYVGKEIHGFALKTEDLIRNSFVGSALVDMYCNCKQVDSGRRIFDAILERRLGLWNAMLTGYTQNGFYVEALTLFMEMEATTGLCSNATTMASILPASVHCERFSDKKSMHGYVVKRGLENDKFVQNALLDLYSRIGKMEISENIFRKMVVRDVVSWNTMITGYVICGRYSDAFVLLHDMQKVKEEEKQRVQLKPNSITLMTVLPGCAALAALAKGKEIHAYAIRNELVSNVTVGSALVDMYAKCGCLSIATKLFERMPDRNVITWNVLIMAYGMHGKAHEAVELFKNMLAGGAKGTEVKPNEVTFIALFAACSHSGMINEGLKLFYTMKDEYQMEPTSEHYACIVDLLGRGGQLQKAYELIDNMPLYLDRVGAWSSMLGACRIHKNVKFGEIAATNLIQSEPYIASHYVLLSNIYASDGQWEKAKDVRRKMTEMGIKKEPGCSWIEYGDKVHKFMAGDGSHPQSEKLHSFLETLSDKMRKEGYVPDTTCVLHNVEEDEKESILCGHSEKLAIAFGILNTRPGTTIRVAKNLRVCNDCHVATKFISKIVGREIIVRDVRRFHHFKEGSCSCGDYW